jgi:callose synthase
MKWIRGSSGGAAKSWSMWWNEENSFYKSMPFVSKMMFLSKSAIFFLVAEGIRRSSLFKQDVIDDPKIPTANVVACIATIVVLSQLFSLKEKSMPYPVRRTIGILIFCGLVACVLTLFLEDTNYMRYTLAAYYAIGGICQVALLYGYNKVCKPFYLIHDLVCGHIIFIPLFLLGAIQLPGMIQTWLLYHNALSADVVVSDILRYARKTQESGSGGGEANEDLVEQITELRKIVQKQEQAMESAGLMSGQNGSSVILEAPRGGPVNASSSIPPSSQIRNQSTEGARAYNRSVSLSGIDVWSTMALGDVGPSEMQPPPDFSSTGQSGTMDGFSFSQPSAMPPR